MKKTVLMVMGIIIAFTNCFMFTGCNEEKEVFAASVGLLCNDKRVMLIMTDEFEEKPLKKSLELPLYEHGNGFSVELYDKYGRRTVWGGYDNGSVKVTCRETNFHHKAGQQVYNILSPGKYWIDISFNGKNALGLKGYHYALIYLTITYPN